MTVEDTGYEEYYQVVVNATNDSGVSESLGSDFAYVFVKVNEDAECVGGLLDMECDLCVGPLTWESNLPEIG